MDFGTIFTSSLQLVVSVREKAVVRKKKWWQRFVRLTSMKI
jgi:hypothetical protein